MLVVDIVALTHLFQFQFSHGLIVGSFSILKLSIKIPLVTEFKLKRHHILKNFTQKQVVGENKETLKQLLTVNNKHQHHQNKVKKKKKEKEAMITMQLLV